MHLCMHACMYVYPRVLLLKKQPSVCSTVFATGRRYRPGGNAPPLITASSREPGTGGARQSMLCLGQAMLVPSTLGFLSSCRPNNAGAAG